MYSLKHGRDFCQISKLMCTACSFTSKIIVIYLYLNARTGLFLLMLAFVYMSFVLEGSHALFKDGPGFVIEFVL